MEIKRDKYLKQIVSYQWDGQIKVITGIKDIRKRWYDDNGVLNIGLIEFLLHDAVI